MRRCAADVISKLQCPPMLGMLGIQAHMREIGSAL